MASTKEITQLIRKLRKRNIPVKQTENNHWKVHCPNGRSVTLASTPSDWRGWRNTKADLKRNGVNLNEQPRRKKAA